MDDRHLYRFENFELNAGEHTLRRDGESLSLTPKMLDMLVVLVQNHGRIVDKDTLFKEVWPDSFVEEGNIAYNVRQLRKLLGDDAQSPCYIETVPRRGYRFIADVEKVRVPPPATVNDRSADNIERPTGEKSSRHSRLPVLIGLSILLAAVIGFGMWAMLRGRITASAAPILDAAFTSEKLTTTGVTGQAAISPDGKKVIYTMMESGKIGVWLRQLDSGSNVEIIPASENYYFGMTFGPDGDTLYFTRRSMSDSMAQQTGFSLYRTTIPGGVPEKLTDVTEGWFSVSPDGQRLSFIRGQRTDEDYYSLWTADAKDGANQRKLITRQRPIRISANKFSPDSRTIAFAYGQSRNAANDFHIGEVNIETGEERELAPSEKFFNIHNLAWLPDRSGILASASRKPTKYYQIWKIDLPAGTAQPLTKDSETYFILSLDQAAKRLVTTQVKQDFRLFQYSLDNPKDKRQLTDGTVPASAPDGKIYFTSIKSGNDEVWSMNADGSEPRQLTSDPADDEGPIPSPDGRTIYFSSNRTGEAQIWRMDPDGGDQRPITRTDGGYPKFATHDGRYLYFQHAIVGTLWRLDLGSGQVAEAMSGVRGPYAFSPDGTQLVCLDGGFDTQVLKLVSFADGGVLYSVEIPRAKFRVQDITWQHDGRAFYYVLFQNEDRRSVVYRRRTDDTAAQQEVADLGSEDLFEVHSFEITPDDKSFIVSQGSWKHDAVLIGGLR